MPAARGLFHKAIQMSGPGLKALSREEASQATLRVLTHLGIRRDKLHKLQQLPAKALLKVMATVLGEVNLSEGDDTWRDGTWYHMFDPVVDGVSLPRNPFDPTAPQVSAGVPMLLGTTAEDARVDAGLRPPLSFSPGFADEPALHASLQSMGLEPDQASYLVQAYRATRPRATPSDLFSAIASDLEYRMDAITMAERKAAARQAPAYMYLFAWESPAFNGKYKSSHAFDIPFVFDNLKLAHGLWGDHHPSPQDRELAAKMSRTWAAFARTGYPGHSDLPPWKPYQLSDRATMVLKSPCEMVNDPGREDRLAIEKLKSRA
jgi:para-nitrobenzyl esterase